MESPEAPSRESGPDDIDSPMLRNGSLLENPLLMENDDEHELEKNKYRTQIPFAGITKPSPINITQSDMNIKHGAVDTTEKGTLVGDRGSHYTDNTISIAMKEVKRRSQSPIENNNDIFSGQQDVSKTIQVEREVKDFKNLLPPLGESSTIALIAEETVDDKERVRKFNRLKSSAIHGSIQFTKEMKTGIDFQRTPLSVMKVNAMPSERNNNSILRNSDRSISQMSMQNYKARHGI